MWLLFGFAAIITTMMNLYSVGYDSSQKKVYTTHKHNPRYGFAGLSLTALTVCAFYSDAAGRVVREDWSGLMDILPVRSKLLWVCVGASVLMNALPLIVGKNTEEKNTEK